MVVHAVHDFGELVAERTVPELVLRDDAAQQFRFDALTSLTSCSIWLPGSDQLRALAVLQHPG
jgi:hypothetical protein